MKTKLTILTGLAWLGILATGLANPVITNRPANTTNAIGTTATICVGATGIEPLAYQWRHVWGGGYADLPGATNACLVLPNVQPWITTNSYRVQVCDIEGCVTSTLSAKVWVVVPPWISQQPTKQALEFGDNYTNRVTVTNQIGALSYQWFFNGDPMPGKTNSAFTMLSVQTTNAGNYHVLVTNLAGATNSRWAGLSVLNGVTFTKITNGPIALDREPSSGAAWGDYDNDGLLDVIVVPNSDAPYPNALYRNLGEDEFVRVTNALTAPIGRSWGAAWDDVDNDDDLDLLILRPFEAAGAVSRNEMFRNDGGGVFTPMTNAATETAARWTDLTWVDHNGDGWLDLFATTVSFAAGQPLEDFFWQSLADGRFAAWTTNEVGPVITPPQDKTVGPAWCDIDGDGDLDLYVSNYGGGTNFLYRNDNGRLIPVKAGSLPAARSTWAATWADFNNDGLFDLFTAGENGTNMLHLNRGNWVFEDVTGTSGLALAGNVFTAAAGDYDNDGDLDLYVPDYYVADVLYVNRGDGTFDRATGGSVVKALTEGVNNGAIWVDYNNDGFLDLFQVCGDITPAFNLLYRNSLPQAGNANHWLKLHLKGTVSNADAIGARVLARAIIGGREVRQVRQVTTGCLGAIPTDGMRPHFGLGDATHVDTLRIEWPSGQVTERHNVAADQILTLVEPLGLRLLCKTADQVCFQVTARPGMSWDLSHCLHLHNLDETCPDTNGHWQLLLSGTNTARTIAVSAPINGTGTNRFYKAEPTP